MIIQLKAINAKIKDLERGAVTALQRENYKPKKKKRKMTTCRTQRQIDDLLDRCVKSEETGESAYPGMSYEQGIKAAIEWLDGGDYPFD